MKQHIPTTAAPLPFSPACLGPDSGVTFLVKPMTQADFDRLGFELFRHNVSPVTQDTFRATAIDEIFKLYDEAKAEEFANLMDEYWQGEDMFNVQFEEWRLTEQERRWDMSKGAPYRDPVPPPQRTMSIRRRTQAQLFVDELKTASRRLRDLTVEMQSYEPRQREGITRLVLEGWSGCSTIFSKPDGIVPDEVFQALKIEIGKEALQELHEFVASLGNVDDVERGNSDLPPASGLDPTGSPAPSEGSVSSDGPSTSEAATIPSTSPGAPIPGSGSGEIIVSSSNSTSDATGAMSTAGPIPTDAG
jgi:hypothetical protein